MITSMMFGFMGLEKKMSEVLMMSEMVFLRKRNVT